jgi:ATP-binding cassette subfamily B protein
MPSRDLPSDSAADPPLASLLPPLRRLWRHLDARRRVQAAALLALTAVTATAEVLAIGAVLPFLAALADPQALLADERVGGWLARFGATDPEGVRILFSVVFAATAVVAGAFRIGLLRASCAWAFATGADLDEAIFRRTLHQPYAVHLKRHSSEVIAGVTSQSNVVIHQELSPALSIVNASLLLAAVVAALVVWRPFAALSAFGGFVAVYGVIAVLSRKRIIGHGEVAAQASTRVIRTLQEGLGGIRDVLLDGTQAHYGRIFASEDRRLRRAQARVQFLGQSPRYAIEALGMTLIAGLAFLLGRGEDGLAGALPTLGGLALAAQRMLPLLQEAYWSYSSLSGAQPTLRETLVLLDQPEPDASADAAVEPIPFREAVRLENVGFRYDPGGPWVLRDVSLTIPRGSRIGVIGTSGGGKSTLLDVLAGLLAPDVGLLSVDGVPLDETSRRRWQARIAQVPQTIHIVDCSMEENIAFGVPPDRIDRARVLDAARRAQIADAIEAMPGGWSASAGERGARLSGGQRQRIGIARALYKRADVLILDEATSALDTETERSVMQTLEALGETVTVVTVAHRLSTLSGCSQVLELRDGRLLPAGSLRVPALEPECES